MANLNVRPFSAPEAGASNVKNLPNLKKAESPLRTYMRTDRKASREYNVGETGMSPYPWQSEKELTERLSDEDQTQSTLSSHITELTQVDISINSLDFTETTKESVYQVAKTTQLYKNIKTFKKVIDRIFENTDDLVTRREYQLLEIFYWGANKTKDHVSEFSEFVKKNNLDENLISYILENLIYFIQEMGSERIKPITPLPAIPEKSDTTKPESNQDQTT